MKSNEEGINENFLIMLRNNPNMQRKVEGISDRINECKSLAEIAEATKFIKEDVSYSAPELRPNILYLALEQIQPERHQWALDKFGYLFFPAATEILDSYESYRDKKITETKLLEIVQNEVRNLTDYCKISIAGELQNFSGTDSTVAKILDLLE